MRSPLLKALAALSLALPLSAFAGGTLYVQSLKAKLLVEPRFGADVVVEAARGEALTLLESEPRWHKVRLGDKSGWVSRLVVSDRAPLNRDTTLDEQAADLEVNVRRRASMATTAGAARGLTYEDRMRASQAGMANYVALEKMEEIKVTEEEALRFLAEGLKP